MKKLRFALFPLILLLGACSYVGMTRDVKELGPNPGLDTVPYYNEGSSSFNSSSAASVLADKKSAELAELSDAGVVNELKEKFVAPDQDIVEDPANPYVPPRTLSSDELPEAVRALPKDAFGYVDWGAAYTSGLVKPRWSLNPKDTGDDPETFDLDIVFEINDRLMSNVMFSHKKHTAWLTCTNCHPSVFIPQKGANIFVMQDVWDGLYCGKCHGKVAFKPKGFDNCQRCHYVKKKTLGIQ